MSREYCPKCGYPLAVCLCAAISPMGCDVDIWVLQHPDEASHAKNTARLLPLVLPQTRILCGESKTDFVDVQAELTARAGPLYLVYPQDETSEPDIAPCSAGAGQSGGRPLLLLIDATWRKALKMYHLNPWLHGLPRLSFQPQIGSDYRIRKAGRSDSLSTLEAVAHGLQCLHPGLDVAPLLAAQTAMVTKRLAAMPAQVRARYRES
ncbi:tRNA-uridine aminocarboxypropyltransferase [Shewanella cyperi]|uniref:tRNA-uridine aminocarboxypropyltransferase n=1 Tax=Shewanella cyperi TaxID=2814292 RepID=UPI001A952212|nr:tRNA-uridine aminocarboxypropyltransferase [Shewanella cyperi]QSX40711.1 DTW domain-containing protein [Shewanella cyperi]